MLKMRRSDFFKILHSSQVAVENLCVLDYIHRFFFGRLLYLSSILPRFRLLLLSSLLHLTRLVILDRTWLMENAWILTYLVTLAGLWHCTHFLVNLVICWPLIHCLIRAMWCEWIVQFSRLAPGVDWTIMIRDDSPIHGTLLILGLLHGINELTGITFESFRAASWILLDDGEGMVFILCWIQQLLQVQNLFSNHLRLLLEPCRRLGCRAVVSFFVSNISSGEASLSEEYRLWEGLFPFLHCLFGFLPHIKVDLELIQIFLGVGSISWHVQVSKCFLVIVL